MIDRCTRWHAAREVQGKDMETLISAIDEMWVSHHGPMKELIVDGETALAKGGNPENTLPEKASKR